MMAAAETQNPAPSALASPERTPHTSCVTRAPQGISGRAPFSTRHSAASDSWDSGHGLFLV